MNEATEAKRLVFVLFGATGDLAWRKIVPALFDLYLDGLLPARFRLLGIGRRDQGAEALRTHLLDGVQRHARHPVGDAQWRAFAVQLDYLRADAADTAAFHAIGDAISACERQLGGQAERIYYLATPPSLFAPIATGLAGAGLAAGPELTRLVVEKPIGEDLASFDRINGTICSHFPEPAVFRIDHFLGNETVQNILAFRFANPMFEPIWDRRYIDHVAVSVTEQVGVESRGGYYDRVGALRDMVQNHLLQLVTMVAMEPPLVYGAEDLRRNKSDTLRAIRDIPRDRVDEFAARGQYEAGVIGGAPAAAYREEADVPQDSRTETFAALKLYIDNWRWQGVPFFLRTGKRLAETISEISVRFRPVPHCTFPCAPGLNAQPGRLVIRLKPEEGIALKFAAKEPGAPLRLAPVEMRFSYRHAFGRETPAPYETLIRDLLAGDCTHFMRADQVRRAWELVTPVLEAWATSPARPEAYPAGSWGPACADRLIGAGRAWLRPTL